mmetsp:Transcript_14040/g.40368  ORF Transcript_14040/g.40368 Transcript_14040/m.40368 type:complete len:214 (-) Transcript_14040:52-693(-)
MTLRSNFTSIPRALPLVAHSLTRPKSVAEWTTSETLATRCVCPSVTLCVVCTDGTSHIGLFRNLHDVVDYSHTLHFRVVWVSVPQRFNLLRPYGLVFLDFEDLRLKPVPQLRKLPDHLGLDVHARQGSERCHRIKPLRVVSRIEAASLAMCGSHLDGQALLWPAGFGACAGEERARPCGRGSCQDGEGKQSPHPPRSLTPPRFDSIGEGITWI